MYLKSLSLVALHTCYSPFPRIFIGHDQTLAMYRITGFYASHGLLPLASVPLAHPVLPHAVQKATRPRV